MKIELFVEYSNEHLSVWTPNLKTKKLDRTDLCHRLLLDLFPSKRCFSHCGNQTRICKIFPELFK